MCVLYHVKVRLTTALSDGWSKQPPSFPVLFNAPCGNLREPLLLNLRQRLLPDFVSYSLDVRPLWFGGTAQQLG